MSVVCNEAHLQECSLIPINSSARKLLASQKLVKVKLLRLLFSVIQVFVWNCSRVLLGPGIMLITLIERSLVILRILKMQVLAERYLFRIGIFSAYEILKNSGSELKFLYIQLGLKSRLFEESCLFKGQRVQQDLQWLQLFVLLIMNALRKLFRKH